MIIWIDKKAIGTKTDQRAGVLKVFGDTLRVRLLGTDEEMNVPATAVTGVEIYDHLTIRFQYSRHIMKGIV